MTSLIMVRVVLGVSGLVLLGIGFMLAKDPLAMHAANGVELVSSPSLMNEMRAPGGALFVAGLFLILALFRTDWMMSAAVLSTIVMIGWALGRGVSLVLDGSPAPALCGALGIEIVLGLASAWAVWALRDTPQ